jgi:VCBS repeat-containing protein
MLVASGVELGANCEAAAALPPVVIGKIEIVGGSGGTISRPSGIISKTVIGDPVYRGDVIEITADGRIGIRFNDGTIFHLSHGARAELCDFLCETDCISSSAQLILTKGNFAFLAGQLAKADSLKLDTPFGSIRSRAHAWGFGMLSLTALVFSTMKEVQAADPDVTLLNDDNITYKDLQHGVFELTTKEAIPRHIIVEDPGETVVLNRRGSSVSVNQFANSATRMEELQLAQQDVLANYAKGLGPPGSGTPPFDGSSPLLHPIKFIQPDDPAKQNVLPPLPLAPPFVPEVLFTAKPPPPPPSLSLPPSPIEVDTLVFDTFAATSGTFSASSPITNATLTFGISGGTAANIVLDGATFDVSDPGSFGTLYLNSVTGAYTFVPNSAAINALSAPTTESFTITVSDGSLSTSQVFRVTLNGVNDAAIISGNSAGSVVEAGGVANAAPGTATATGTLTDTDVDNPPNTFAPVSSSTRSAGGYGTFTITAAGVWIYTVDNNNSAIQALNVGDKLTDSFTVTTVDGTPQVVTITISGTNDAAIISGTTIGSVVEASGASPGSPTTSGTLADTDVDNPANTFVEVSSTKSTSGYGAFTITAAGVWTYTLDNTNGAVEALGAGEKLTDSFTVTTSDGTPQVVTITISGTNDAAVISGTTAGAVAEAGGVANATPGTPNATGTLTDTDVDNPSNAFVEVLSTKSTGGFGTFTMTEAGVWTYTLDDNNSAVQALNVGDQLTDNFTVSTIDGTSQLVTITINGANDAAIISGTIFGSVIEAGGASPGTPTASGTLTDTDVDNAPSTFVDVKSLSDGGYGTFTMTATGVWTYTLDNNNSVVDALNAGDTLTDTFTVHTIDGTAQVVTVSIHGASDADPNDFDNLALGSVVVTQPPFVFGTPGSDSIAGGGDVPQTIYGGAGNDTLNGTGVVDTIYGGSGNDTIKGNNGDDTIYGGSGSDTINGSNGNDTIIGGFGADNLTGSNGNDRFVYLSVADSRAGRFDTITDFVSGSDRIDVTAFGALAFVILALTSTSSTVPAHTIAWIYDSAANETIVYVNPTDQTLSIGDSGLLEVHLQGLASIEASDFIIDPPSTSVALASASADLAASTLQTDAPLATDASSTSTATGSTLLADASWTADTTNVGYSLDTARKQIDSHDGARLISADDPPSQATEEADNSAAITLADGKSIGAPHVHGMTLTESDLAFALSPAFDHGGNGNAVGPSGTIHDTIFAAIAALNAEPGITHGVKGVEWDVPSHGNGNAAVDSGANPSSASGKVDHGASKNTDNPGHAGADTTVSPGPLNASNNNGNGSGGESNSPPGHDNGVHDPWLASTTHIPPGWGTVDDSFHFKSSSSEGLDVAKHGTSDHILASMAHHEDIIAALAGDGTHAIGLEELQLFDVSDSHAKGAGAGHVTHDLIV